MNPVVDVLIAITAFALLITIVVVVHESGHYVFAKLFGIRVDEFSVGFGPRLFGVRRGDTLYGVRALPLGGFVRMPGMLGLEGEADAGERNFYRASIPKRMITILAGIVFNFVFGAVCLAVVYSQPQPSRVTPGEATAAAGLHDGDVIVAIGGQSIDTSSPAAVATGLHAATQSSQGRPLSVEYRSPDGTPHSATIRPELVLFANVDAGPVPANLARHALVVTSVGGKPAATGDPAAVLGGGGPVTIAGFTQHGIDTNSGGDRFGPISVSSVSDGDGSVAGLTAAWRIGYAAGQPGESLPRALADGALFVPSFIGQTADVIAHLFITPSQTAGQLSGPVGIAAQASTSIRQGWVQFVFLIGVISLSLGFVNVLPIPFLDGGRFLFVAIEAVRRRRVDPKREAVAHAVGLALLILVFVFITISDIHNISGGQH